MTRRRLSWPLLLATLVGWLCVAATARAQDAASPRDDTLRIGVESLGISVDPHQLSNLSTRSLLAHLYEPLVLRDANLKARPGLAVAWNQRPDGAWLFQLRPDVRFHRGGRLDATDVVYSLCRILVVPRSDMAATVRQFVAVDTPSPDSVLIRPAVADLDVPRQMMELFITDAPAGWNGRFTPQGCQLPAGAPALDGTPAADIDGTGPFILTDHEPSRRLTLRRFDDHWAGPPRWATVEMIQISSATARVRALSQNEVDIIDMVPAESLEYLSGRSDLRTVAGPVSRAFFLHMNQRPGAANVNGRNPMADPRVRRAMSLAIDRIAVTERAAGGQALPTAQLVPAGMEGHQPDLPDNPFNPEEARRLMKEAGYGDGFSLTLICQDYALRVSQTVARYLQQIGILVTIRTFTEPVTVREVRNANFDLFVGSANLFTGDFTTLVRKFLGTPDIARGIGVNNHGGFERPEMDALVSRLQGLPIRDSGRADLIRRIVLLASEQTALVPLAHAGRLWAIRDNLAYTGRIDGLTLAMEVTLDTH